MCHVLSTCGTTALLPGPGLLLLRSLKKAAIVYSRNISVLYLYWSDDFYQLLNSWLTADNFRHFSFLIGKF